MKIYDASHCRRYSQCVKYYPPIRIQPQPDNIGKNVYCGNNAVDEYWRKQAEEHGRKEA